MTVEQKALPERILRPPKVKELSRRSEWFVRPILTLLVLAGASDALVNPSSAEEIDSANQQSVAFNAPQPALTGPDYQFDPALLDPPSLDLDLSLYDNSTTELAVEAALEAEAESRISIESGDGNGSERIVLPESTKKTFYYESLEKVSGCRNYIVYSKNQEIENEKDPLKSWSYCGKESEQCFVTVYQEPPVNGVCTTHYITSNKPINGIDFSQFMDPERISLPLDQNIGVHIILNLNGFDESERFSVIEGQFIRALGTLGLVFGPENIEFDTNEFFVFKSDHNGYYGDGRIALSDADALAHELFHAAGLPRLKNMPGLSEGLSTYLDMLTQDVFVDFSEIRNEYDRFNASGLMEKPFLITGQYYQMSAEALRQLEEQRPGFLRDLNIAYNKWLVESNLKKPHSLSEEQFRRIIDEIWPNGGWEIINQHNILFTRN